MKTLAVIIAIIILIELAGLNPLRAQSKSTATVEFHRPIDLRRLIDAIKRVGDKFFL